MRSGLSIAWTHTIKDLGADRSCRTAPQEETEAVCQEVDCWCRTVIEAPTASGIWTRGSCVWSVWFETFRRYFLFVVQMRSRGCKSSPATLLRFCQRGYRTIMDLLFPVSETIATRPLPRLLHSHPISVPRDTITTSAAAIFLIPVPSWDLNCRCGRNLRTRPATFAFSPRCWLCGGWGISAGMACAFRSGNEIGAG